MKRDAIYSVVMILGIIACLGCISILPGAPSGLLRATVAAPLVRLGVTNVDRATAYVLDYCIRTEWSHRNGHCW